jgi:DNA-binding response OmpR family regulator
LLTVKSMVESVDELLAPEGPLSHAERAVLGALLSVGGRVLSREELAERSGLSELSARRVDSILVGLRRHIGTDAIVTVRARGWRFAGLPSPVR